MTEPQLRLSNLRKRYGPATVCNDIAIDVAAEEFLTILGPSGSGKTTLLMMIAGFTIPDAGTITLGGTDVTRWPAQRRDIGVVFQNYALFPHLDVFENLAYPLRVRHEKAATIRDRVEWALDLVQLSGLEDRHPAELSGGQQQRIALARAVIFQPRLLLMDEPLGALDKKLRDYMQVELKALQRRLRTTVVYVTHDQDEAMSMSDRIAVLDHGRIAQLDTPRAIYQNPASRFVAEFMGDAVLIDARVQPDGITLRSLSGDHPLHATARHPLPPHSPATVMVRPEAIVLGAIGCDTILTGRLEEIVFLGDYVRCRVELAAGLVITLKHPSHVPLDAQRIGEPVQIGWRQRDASVLQED